MKAVAWHAIRRKYCEPVAWTAVLAALYFMEPTAPSLCLFKAVGFSHCPGCGIGHAIHYALHGQLGLSWKAHWLGIPATGVMFWIVVKPFFSLYKKHALQHEPATAYDHSGPAA